MVVEYLLCRSKNYAFAKVVQFIYGCIVFQIFFWRVT